MFRRRPNPGDAGGPADQELLDRLAAALGAPEVEPDASALGHLSAAVSARWAPPPSPPAPLPHHIHWPRRLSPLALAGATVGALVAGTGISYAVGGPAPAPVRSIARSVGLAPSPPATAPTTPPTTPPTTVPPAVTEARQAESTLRRALATKNVSPAVVSRDSSDLARRLAQFGGDREPWALGTTADGHQLLDQACRQLYGAAPPSAGATSTSTAPTAPTSTTGSPATTQPAPSNSTHCTSAGSWTANSPGNPGYPTSGSTTTPTTSTTRTAPPRPTHRRRGEGSPGSGTSPGPYRSTSTTYEDHFQSDTTTTSTSEPTDQSTTTTTSTTSPGA